MGKSAGTQTTATNTTNSPDAQARNYMTQVFDAAGGAGQGAATNAARNFYSSALPGANLGMSALAGDTGATQQLLNPYMSQVMDRMKAQFGDINALTSRGINDQATQAGAFGGARHGIAEGVALGQNGKSAQDAIAAYLDKGYGDAMGRASGLANFGMGAAQQLPGLDPSMMRFLALKGAGQGMPFGSTSNSTSTQPVNKNRMSGALGGAATGAEIGSFFPGAGTAIGAGLGGLIGLFG